LFELLVVLAVLAVVAGLCMPPMARQSDNLLLRVAVRELIDALRITRSGAIARNTEMVLTIDVDEGALRSPAAPRRIWSPEIVAKVTFAEPERLSHSRGGFRFYPDGSSSGGEVLFSIRTAQTRVCVDWFTGGAKIADRNGPSCAIPR
jgi:general secretion pathway protein H